MVTVRHVCSPGQSTSDAIVFRPIDNPDLSSDAAEYCVCIFQISGSFSIPGALALIVYRDEIALEFNGPRPVVAFNLSGFEFLAIVVGRTHEELAARAAESCMTDPGPNAFVAMPFVHGPSSVKFNDECPAKLRFFVGFVDDFEDVDDEEDEGHKVRLTSWCGGHCKKLKSRFGFTLGFRKALVALDWKQSKITFPHPSAIFPVQATSDLKTLLLRKFEPLVSPDEVFWTMQMPFEVIERPQLGLPTEAWLETKIYHFSTFALADVNPGFKDPGSDLLKDWYVLGDVPRRLPPWRRSGWSRKKPSIFLLGNATTSQARRSTICVLHCRALRLRLRVPAWCMGMLVFGYSRCSEQKFT